MGNRFCFCCCGEDWCACDPSIRLKMWFTVEYYRDHVEDTRPTFWYKADGMLGLSGTYEHIFDRDEDDCTYLHPQTGPVLSMGIIEWSSYLSPTPTLSEQTAQFTVTSEPSPYIWVNYLENYNGKYTATPTPYRHQICREGAQYWIWDLVWPPSAEPIIPSDEETLHLRREFSDSLGPYCLMDTFYQFIRV